MPAWGATLIAVTGTLTGFAIEAGLGHSELGATFAVCYALGCLAAVLAVRQSGIFTAVIQPPLVLFVAVPTAYFLLHGSAFSGLKDILITCGYPLIERFPLMLFTSSGVLLAGLIRWYLGQSGHPRPAAAPTEGPGRIEAVAAKLSALFSRPDGAATRPRHGVDRSARPAEARPSRNGRPPRERTRTRETRDVRGDGYGAPPRPRRPDPRERPRRTQGTQSPQRSQRRTPPPQRRDPRDGRGGRSGQYLPYQPYEPYPDPYPPLRRPAPNGHTNHPTHHPVSRVRYRGSADDGGHPDRSRR